MPFQPGQSGNPAGRPRVSRNKKTIVLEAMVDGEAEAVMQKMITLAKMGQDGPRWRDAPLRRAHDAAAARAAGAVAVAAHRDRRRCPAGCG